MIRSDRPFGWWSTALTASSSPSSVGIAPFRQQKPVHMGEKIFIPSQKNAAFGHKNDE
ncbi:hypothetical protein [Azospirillum sp. B506]|uniref:hypothetical protein n=1 Tax=Azospirillum sp. B506 TaxID=137721 RepID=UPI00131F2A56|nr:hypothetical protein [Azospirillum sp. B506]